MPSRRRRSEFPAAVPSRAVLAAHAAAARVFQASEVARSKAVNAGQIAEYVGWQQRTWDRCPRILGRREQLWERLAGRLDPGRPVFALEFGVAWGYATNWWLTRLPGDVTWHGFDRFTGLPRAWRDHDAGTFDAGGRPPPIRDPRVHWHVGDVEATLPTVDLTTTTGGQRLVLFDLDLYEPTAFAWKAVAAHLEPGDLLYFDEAMDADERRVVDELVLPAVRCELVGATPLALGLRIV
jgi:hypothetical protein